MNNSFPKRSKRPHAPNPGAFRCQSCHEFKPIAERHQGQGCKCKACHAADIAQRRVTAKANHTKSTGETT